MWVQASLLYDANSRPLLSTTSKLRMCGRSMSNTGLDINPASRAFINRFLRDDFCRTRALPSWGLPQATDAKREKMVPERSCNPANGEFNVFIKTSVTNCHNERKYSTEDVGQFRCILKTLERLWNGLVVSFVGRWWHAIGINKKERVPEAG